MTKPPEKRRYAIVGVGAVGGFYGIRLQHSGCDVHFLLHDDYEHVKQYGVRLDSVDGDIHLPSVNAYAKASNMPPCDVVLVCLKAYANRLLAGMLPPLVHPGTTVVLMQNGLGAEAFAAQIVPEADILGGLCFLCSNRVGPGHIQHLDYGRVMLGTYTPDDRPAGITPAMERVAADLAGAGIEVTMAEDLLLARWKKLVWNIPFNGLSVLYNADTHEIMARPERRQRAVRLMREVCMGAAAIGREIPDSFVEKMIVDTERMAPYQPSMKLDKDAGRPLELEAIYAEPLRAAGRAGVELPEIERLLREVQQLQSGQ